MATVTEGATAVEYGMLVALIAAQIAFYWILNRKIEGMKAGKPEETPPPPEMKGEP